MTANSASVWRIGKCFMGVNARSVSTVCGNSTPNAEGRVAAWTVAEKCALAGRFGIGNVEIMPSLTQVQKQADELSTEDRQGLLAYLIHSLPSPPLGADDHEVMRREAEMDSGEVQAISHEQFLAEVGRGR